MIYVELMVEGVGAGAVIYVELMVEVANHLPAIGKQGSVDGWVLETA